MTPSSPRIAIACGGTGGHLYPGLAVAERLWEREAEVTLFVSSKEVDQRALRTERRFPAVLLPAVGFSVLRCFGFAARFWRSYRISQGHFREWTPGVLLSTGGFTSAGPALAARSMGIPVVLHEANAIPGRANRWLARFAQGGYVYFPEAAHRMKCRDVKVVGMPVREQFQESDPLACRPALGLAVDRPVLLVMGGSQGARALNELMVKAAPELAKRVPGLQVLHLTGTHDEERIRKAYQAAGIHAVIRPFLTEMELAIGAADLAVARAGASSIAELAAMRLPAILIPYPFASDNHQLANARALERTSAAWTLSQSDATPERFATETGRLLTMEKNRAALRRGMAEWHRPDAAAVLAEELLTLARRRAAPMPEGEARVKAAHRATTA